MEQAILNEHEGSQFYILASEKAEDQGVKEIFKSLATEEQQHEKILRNSLSGQIGKKQENQVDNQNTGPVSPGIFEPEKLKNAGSISPRKNGGRSRVFLQHEIQNIADIFTLILSPTDGGPYFLL